VQIADAFVVGKAYSTFVDADGLPTTLDYNGPSRATSTQQWLARTSIFAGSGLTLAVAVEDSRANSGAGGGALDVVTVSPRAAMWDNRPRRNRPLQSQQVR